MEESPLVEEFGFSLKREDDTEHPNIIIVRLSGDVHFYTEYSCRQFLLEAIWNRYIRGIAVDLSNVTYMDSTGLAALLEVWKEIIQYEGDLVLFGKLGLRIKNLIKITRKNKHLKLFETEEAALSDLRPRIKVIKPPSVL